MFYFVYILTNKSNTLYVGVTNNLPRRIWEHKNHYVKGFTQKYKIDKLIYFEEYHDINRALLREREIKGWLRRKKIELIKSINPSFEDLGIKFGMVSVKWYNPIVEKITCGECTYFDKKKVNGNPFGNEEGVCRTNGGLLYGKRSPQSLCVQPEGVAMRIKENYQKLS